MGVVASLSLRTNSSDRLLPIHEKMQMLMIDALVTLLVQRSRCRELTPSSGGHSNCRLLLNADRCFGDLLTGLWKQGGSEDRSKEAAVGNRPGAPVVIQTVDQRRFGDLSVIVLRRKMMIATTMIVTWSMGAPEQ